MKVLQRIEWKGRLMIRKTNILGRYVVDILPDDGWGITLVDAEEDG